MGENSRIVSLYQLLLSSSDMEYERFLESVCTGMTGLYSLGGTGLAFRVGHVPDLHRVQYADGKLEGLAGAEFRFDGATAVFTTGSPSRPAPGISLRHYRSGDGDFSLFIVPAAESLPDDGQMEPFIGFFHDIIRKKNLRPLQKEVERHYSAFRDLFETSPSLSVLLDLDGNIVAMNRIGSEKYGYDLDSSPINFKEVVREEDFNRAITMFRNLYRSASGLKKHWDMRRVLSDADYRAERYRELLALGLKDEQLRVYSRDRRNVYSLELCVNLRVDRETLDIYGVLVTAVDVTQREKLEEDLRDSEKKYRELIENKTRDIIFTTDRNGNFITGNRNFRIRLGYAENYLKGRHLSSILYSDPMDKDGINLAAFQENLEKALGGGTDVRFNAVCRHYIIGEPVTLHFKIDPVYEAGTVAGIMGFMSDISDDPLRKYLTGESISYRIDSRLTRVDDISYRLTRSLAKQFDPHRVSMIRLGLREIIVNAIEHGNLKISFQDKTEAQGRGAFFELLRRQQSEEGLGEKAVRISYRLETDRVVYEIEDEGDGFDFWKVLNEDPSVPNELNLEHGRGLLLAKSIFDRMEFDGKGNRVSLTVFFPGTDNGRG
jgi:PAS domain S-box-containing protein